MPNLLFELPKLITKVSNFFKNPIRSIKITLGGSTYILMIIAFKGYLDNLGKPLNSTLKVVV